MLLRGSLLTLGTRGQLIRFKNTPLPDCGGEFSAYCRVIPGYSSATRDAVPWPCPEKVAKGLISGHRQVLELLDGLGKAERDGLIIRRAVRAIGESADPVSIVLFVLFVLRGCGLPQVKPAIWEPRTESQIGIASASVMSLLSNCLRQSD